MPKQRCQKNNKKGWKAGPSQKCYTGKNAKQKAQDQLGAIKSNRKR